MLSVNLPINTSFFNNNSIKTFTKACNKASETMKSTIVSKFKDLDLAKSRSDATLSKVNTPSDTKTTTTATTTTTTITTTTTTTTTVTTVTTTTITITTTPSSISSFINSDKNQVVDDIENSNTNLKKTEQVVENTIQGAVQLSSCSLDDIPLAEYTKYTICKNSPAEIDEMSEASSFGETERYESDEESIFDPPTTTPYLYHQACKYSVVIYPRIEAKSTLTPVYDEPIVAEFMELVDEMYEKSIVTKHTVEDEVVADLLYFFATVQIQAREEIRSVSIEDTPSYVLDFCRMVENDQHLNMVSVYDTNYITDFFSMAEKSGYSTKPPIPDTTNYVSGFFNMVEDDHYSIKSPIDAASYTSNFFKMIEEDQESKMTKQEITIDFIWLQIYKILSNEFCNQRVRLFELSQLETKENTKFPPKVPQNKRTRDIPRYGLKPLTRRPRTLHVT